jgi:hypothetical protein
MIASDDLAQPGLRGLRARLRAANPVPPIESHEQLLARLRGYDENPGRLWRLIGGDDVPVFDCGDAGEDAPRRRTRRPSITSVIRQMKRAGVEIAGCKVDPRDGTVLVLTGKPDETTTPETTDDHSWDDIDAQAKTKPPVH